MNSKNIQNVKDPVDNQDDVTKNYFNNNLSSYLSTNKIYSKIFTNSPTNQETYLYLDINRPHILCLQPINPNSQTVYTCMLYLFPNYTSNFMHYKCYANDNFSGCFGVIYTSSSIGDYIYLPAYLGKIRMYYGTLTYINNYNGYSIWEL